MYISLVFLSFIGACCLAGLFGRQLSSWGAAVIITSCLFLSLFLSLKLLGLDFSFTNFLFINLLVLASIISIIYFNSSYKNYLKEASFFKQEFINFLNLSLLNTVGLFLFLLEQFFIFALKTHLFEFCVENKDGVLNEYFVVQCSNAGSGSDPESTPTNNNSNDLQTNRENSGSLPRTSTENRTEEFSANRGVNSNPTQNHANEDMSALPQDLQNNEPIPNTNAGVIDLDQDDIATLPPDIDQDNQTITTLEVINQLEDWSDEELPRNLTDGIHFPAINPTQANFESWTRYPLPFESNRRYSNNFINLNYCPNYFEQMARFFQNEENRRRNIFLFAEDHLIIHRNFSERFGGSSVQSLSNQEGSNSDDTNLNTLLGENLSNDLPASSQVDDFEPNRIDSLEEPYTNEEIETLRDFDLFNLTEEQNFTEENHHITNETQSNFNWEEWWDFLRDFWD